MKPRKTYLLPTVGAIAALLVVSTLPNRRATHRQNDSTATLSVPAGITPPAPPAAASVPPTGVVLRPLPVVRSSANHEWTAEDAMDPEVIEKIAHNPDEFIRLNQENERIERRQLVYRKETVPMLLDRARNTGRPLESFMLPGLDGREIEVEVTGTNLAANQQGGSVNGRVKGRLNSMVSVGFSNGCESFNVISPDEGLFLTADAREPGEVLVKEIDLEKYTAPPGNTPDFILTGDAPPHQKPETQVK